MKPYYDHDGITIYHGDCRQVLPMLRAGSADFVLTDVPYNVGKNYDGYDDRLSTDDYATLLRETFSLCRPHTRDGLCFFPGVVNVMKVPSFLDGTGFSFRRLLGWHRREFAGDLWAGGPAMSWEPIVWAGREPKPVFTRRYGVLGRDFLVVNSARRDWTRAHHPCPKAIEVARWLVGLFCERDWTVLDPFCGSGAILRAAKEMGCRAIGVDQSEKYCALSVKRMAQGLLEFTDEPSEVLHASA